MAKAQKRAKNKESTNKIVDLKPKQHNPITQIRLSSVELLRLKNLALQLDKLKLEDQNIRLQESLVLKDVSTRVGVNVDLWNCDYEQGVLVKQTE